MERFAIILFIGVVVVLLAGAAILAVNYMDSKPLVLPSPTFEQTVDPEPEPDEDDAGSAVQYEYPEGPIKSWAQVKEFIAWMASVKDAVDRDGYVTVKIMLPDARELNLQSASTDQFPDNYDKCVIVFAGSDETAKQLAIDLHKEGYRIFTASVDSHPQLADRYAVTKEPTFVATAYGIPLVKIVGIPSKQELRKLTTKE